MIIDPWERDILSKILFFICDQYLLFKRIEKFVKSNLDSIHTIVIASYDNLPTDKVIQNLPGNILYATTIKEITPIIEENNIKNIYMAGSAWERCVAHRSLGYLNLRKHFKDINLLVKDDCVIYSEDYNAKIFDPELNLDWCKTTVKGVYKYGK